LATAERASPWIARFAHLIPAGASVLDVACGAGRHARFFAARCCTVDAVDREPALAAEFAAWPGVRFLAADIEAGPWPYASRQFDAVVVTNYLHRPLLPVLRAAVAPGGVLLYETFAVGNERYGRPRNPDFLLRPRELLEAFADLHLLAFEDGVLVQPVPARVQRLAAVRATADDHARLQLAAEARVGAAL
jgi:SAM-dependent methyltransferase